MGKENHAIMARYEVTVSDNVFEHSFMSDSRNAKAHLMEDGGNLCSIRNKNGKIISQCKHSLEFGYYYALDFE